MPYTEADMRARILYSSPDVIILDKPPGLPVHYGKKADDHLELYLPLIAGEGAGGLRLAHRLDKDTSGCLVLARSAASAARLSHLFVRGMVEKIYWAVVVGRPGGGGGPAAGQIDLPLMKVEIPGCSKVVTDPAGKPALTDWRLMGTDGRHSWLELKPRTGRMHQIRAHCAYSGFPILGDPIYGPEQPPPVPLHLLAREVSLPDGPPGTARLTAKAPPPPHMAATLAGLGWRAD